jgi:2-desacetyl-2-hydroxyethyl bacteriochlorophyllide A dehydrogenase
MAERLVFTGKREVRLEEFEPGSLDSDKVAVKAICSLISTGTEGIIFNRLFDPGTHWDKWVKYPFYPGYASVGKVTAAGDEVSFPRVGDTVVHRSGHASEAILPVDLCYVLSDGIEPEHASWFALGKIASMGARAAGDLRACGSVVVGAGPVGQMMIRWLAALGAFPIIAVDTISMRLDLASKGGATHVICKPISEAVDEIREITTGRLADVVVDTTGHHRVFADALAVVRKRGRLVLLGDSGTPTKQHLTHDVVVRGLTIVGAHDGHEDEEWNAKKIYSLFFHLMQTRRFDVEGLILHRFKPENCQEAYRFISEHREKTMGVLFNWTD